MLKIFKKSLPNIDFKDILVIIGAILISKGLYMVYQPAMYIFLGLTLSWLGWPSKEVR